MDSQVMWLIRLLFLFYFGSMGAIVPFMSVYYHSIGHGGPIIGLLSAIKPLTTFLVLPLWGILSDWSQNPVLVLQVALLVSVIGKLLVPTVEGDATHVAIIVFLTALFAAPIKSLLDALILSRIHDRSYYGRLRLFGQVGFALGTFLMGHILSARENNNGGGGIFCSSSSSSDTTTTTWWCHASPPVDSSLLLLLLPRPVLTRLATLSFWIERNFFTGYKLIFAVHGALSIPALFCIRSLDRMDQKKKKKKQQNKAAAESLSRQQEQEQEHNNNNNKAANTTTTNNNNGIQASSNNKSQNDTVVVQKKKTSFLEGLSTLVKENPNALVFFVLVFVAGMNAGVNEAFGNLRIRELGGTPQLMGIFRVVGACGGAPMFWFSGTITKRFLGGGGGDNNNNNNEETSSSTSTNRAVLLFLIIHMARFASLGIMTHVSYALPGELLKSASFAIFMSSITVYTHKISPQGMNATLLMLVNGLYSGLGVSFGSILSGKLQHMFGTAQAFCYVALFDLVFIALVLVYLFGLQRRQQPQQPSSGEANNKIKTA